MEAVQGKRGIAGEKRSKMQQYSDNEGWGERVIYTESLPHNAN